MAMTELQRFSFSIGAASEVVYAELVSPGHFFLSEVGRPLALLISSCEYPNLRKRICRRFHRERRRFHREQLSKDLAKGICFHRCSKNEFVGAEFLPQADGSIIFDDMFQAIQRVPPSMNSCVT